MASSIQIAIVLSLALVDFASVLHLQVGNIDFVCSSIVCMAKDREHSACNEGTTDQGIACMYGITIYTCLYKSGTQESLSPLASAVLQFIAITLCTVANVYSLV